MIKKKPKILAPVGSTEMLVTAIKAKADAVYLGVKGTNMRERATNFEINALSKVVSYAHKHNVEVYLTLNTFIYNNEIEKIKKIIKKAKDAKIDAIIAWDLAIVRLCKKNNIICHLSTQASVSNIEAIKEYYKIGVKRFILARECSLEHIKEITKQVKKISKDIEIEVFIHGAMCVAVSGRCLLSAFLYGNNTSANKGLCIQPCRRKYIALDPETNKKLEVHSNYVLSPKDLCTIKFIDKIIDSGVDILKIEGRARNPEYVMTVVSCYREAVDAYFSGCLDISLKDKLYEKLKKVYNKGFSDGFYLGKPINEFAKDYGSVSKETKVFVGFVQKIFKKINVVEVRLVDHSLKINDSIYVIGKKTGVIRQKIKSMQKDVNNPINVAKKGDVIAIKFDKDLPKTNEKVYLIKKR
jgi:U32 family peptidase